MKRSVAARTLLAVLAAATLAFSPGAAPGQTPGQPPDKPPLVPIAVTADSLVVEEGGALIRFEGKVTLRRGPVTLTCDKLVLRAADGDPSQIKTGEAEGSVLMRREGDRAEAQRASFDLAAGQVVLTGSPFLVRGTDTIRGAEITYTMSDGRAAFRGPVDATFTPSTPALPSQPARGASVAR